VKVFVEELVDEVDQLLRWPSVEYSLVTEAAHLLYGEMRLIHGSNDVSFMNVKLKQQ
jgi:hypothetical protein